MKNVLFIVYYFPPMGGSGVQRPLKFVKYLREFGWNPIILRPEPGMYKVFDESLQEELAQIKAEQYEVKGNTPFHVFGGKKRTAEFIPDFVGDWVRKGLKLFMYPDNKKGWIEPGFQKGVELLGEREVDLIFSTAPPFSNHLLGARLKEHSKKPLILDYRDSWTQNQFFTDLYGWQKKVMEQQEQESVQSADTIIGLDEVTLQDIASTHGLSSEKMRIVEHGFDPDDFALNVESSLDSQPDAFNLLYSGTFVEHNQPDSFLKGVAKGIQRDLFHKEELHLHFQGGLNPDIRKLIANLGLQNMVTEYEYMDHKKAVANLKAADGLWLLENYDPKLTQIKNGKLFEYFGSRKPIMGVVNPGVSANLLEQYGPGFIADVRNPDSIANKLQAMIACWKSGSFDAINTEFVASFNRKKLTQKLAHIFDKISSQ